MFFIRIGGNRCRICDLDGSVGGTSGKTKTRGSSAYDVTLMKPVIISLILLSLPLSSLRAHDEMVSASRLQISKHEAIWDVDVGLLGLEKVMKFPAETSEPPKQEVGKQVAKHRGEGLWVEKKGQEGGPPPGPLEPIYEPFML